MRRRANFQVQHLEENDMPYANINGQNLYYRDSGGGDGPAIVFSHGLLMDHEMFGPQLHVFRHHYRCITWDERGHGRTADDHIEPFSYYDSADDLAALLAHLGIKQAVLAGMSQGGYLSLRCALTHPEIVRALILIDTQAQTEDPAEVGRYKQMIEVWAQQGLSDQIADTIEQIILVKGWSGTETWRHKWQQWQPHNLQACFHALVSRDDISDRLGQIKMPALVIHGEVDMAITLDRAKDMVQRLPDAKLVTVPGAGHAVNLTHPAPVNAVIESFLSGLS